MKALTIRQPWASLTLMLDENGKAFKQVETRSRRTNYRGRLAIHAGLAKEPFGVIAVSDLEASGMKPLCDFKIGPDFAVIGLPYGAIIGEVTIRDCVPIDELWGTTLCTAREVSFGDWRKQRGRYGWILEDPVMYDQPIPARGQPACGTGWGDDNGRNHRHIGAVPGVERPMRYLPAVGE